jgi:pimeloyl-ACP methyl ester carboxylesterase/class 3 adenylate cyclase
MGDGPVLIVPPGGKTHIEWYTSDTAAQERFCARLAEHNTLVLYDQHGCGLSDRNRTDFTPEDDMVDLRTVIEAVGADTVAFFGISAGGTFTLAYTAEHPERVRRIVLYGTSADGPRRLPDMDALGKAMADLRRADFEAYLRAMAARFFPSGTDPETFQSLVRHMRDSTTIEMAEKLEAIRWDNQSVLSSITVPALVLHRRGDMQCPFIAGQYLARKLRNARFVPLEGDAHYPWVGDADSVLRPTIEFLTGKPSSEMPPAPGPPQGTAIILFADIADSTSLTERLGDAVFHDRALSLDAALRAAVRDNDGTVIEGKLLGDGLLATFTSAKQAIDASLRCLRAGQATGLQLHLGIHAGDVIREEANVHGGAVNIAARISDAALPGEVLVSDTVRSLARTSARVTFDDRGEIVLKGVAEAQRVFAVRAL